MALRAGCTVFTLFAAPTISQHLVAGAGRALLSRLPPALHKDENYVDAACLRFRSWGFAVISASSRSWSFKTQRTGRGPAGQNRAKNPELEA